MAASCEAFMDEVKSKNPNELEFHQAVKEVLESIWSFLEDNSHYLHLKV